MDLTAYILLVAIVAALFSDKMDQAVSGNGTLRKVILVSAAGVFLLTLIPMLFQLCCRHRWPEGAYWRFMPWGISTYAGAHQSIGCDLAVPGLVNWKS